MTYGYARGFAPPPPPPLGNAVVAASRYASTAPAVPSAARSISLKLWSHDGKARASGDSGDAARSSSPDTMEDAAWSVPALSIAAETEVFATIKEHWRIHRMQRELEEIMGRHVSVAEWASAAGYGDSAGMLAALNVGARAMDRLVRHHRPLVLAMARKYRRVTKSMTLDDLIQEGRVGLMTAVDRFDPSRGAHFGTYAGWQVRACILRAISNKDALIRLPVHAQDLASKLRTVARKLGAAEAGYGGGSGGFGGGGPEPTDAALAAAAGVTVEAVVEHRNLVENAVAALAVDGALDSSAAAEAGVAVGGGGAGEAWFGAPAREDLLRVLDMYLAPREIEALRLRFGLGQGDGGLDGRPLTFVEVGRAMQLSGEGIRRIVFRALDKLRRDEAMEALSALEMG